MFDMQLMGRESQRCVASAQRGYADVSELNRLKGKKRGGSGKKNKLKQAASCDRTVARENRRTELPKARGRCTKDGQEDKVREGETKRRNGNENSS